MIKENHAPNPELRKIALDFYKGPFRFDDLGGYIWAQGDKDTKGSQMFADLDAAKERCARIRGWGALQYLKDVDCEALQDEIGMMFAEAITEYWDRAKNTVTFEVKDPLIDKGESVNDLVGWVKLHGGPHSDCSVISRVKPGLKMATAPEHCDYFVQLELPTHGIHTMLKPGDKVTLQEGRVLLDLKPWVMRLGFEVPMVAVMPKLGDPCPDLVAILDHLKADGLHHSLTLTTDTIGELAYTSGRKLVIPAHGIERNLLEGDVVTLQYGRVTVQAKPITIGNLG